jgi:uncharacterized lipoprotein YddW (UPF0748 family)
LWMEYGFYSYHTRDAMQDASMGPLLDAHPELAAVDARGQRHLHNPAWGDYYSLCPSNPRSHELLAELATEALLLLHPAADGLNLDRIRYPTADYCYCDYCRMAFERDTGIALQVFAIGSGEAEQFLQWKRRQTVAAVAHIRQAVHGVRPGLPITAYVVGPEEMDARAQGWDLWMQEGLLDGIAVSMYGDDISAPAQRAIELLGGDVSKLICAIAAGRPTPAYLSNIEHARRLGAMGQFTWYLGDVIDDLDALASGPYRRPATSPFAGPTEGAPPGPMIHQ